MPARDRVRRQGRRSLHHHRQRPCRPRHSGGTAVMTDKPYVSPALLRPLRSEAEAYGVTPGKLGCDYCSRQPKPGWLETIALGTIPCPVCNKGADHACTRDLAPDARRIDEPASRP